MKVLLITYYWPPAGGPGVQRSVKFAKYLPEFGITPLVLTVDADKGTYPIKDHSLEKDISGTIKTVRTNTFEPLNLYSRLLKKDVPYSGFANESDPSFLQKISRFIRGNLFIPDARRGWNRYAIKAAKKLIKEEGIKAIITSSPPHSTQLIGLQLKKIFNIPWIADMRDPWTDIYYYHLMMHTSFASNLDKQYEKEVLENADAVLVTNKDTKLLFQGKSGKINGDKIHVVYNGFDEQDFAQRSMSRNTNFLITYTGTIADNYPVAAFAAAFKRFAEGKPKVKLRFVGKVSESVRAKFSDTPHNVEFIAFVPHKESINYLQQSNVLLIAVPEVKNNEAILPGKLFEYLAAQKPIICLGPRAGDVAKIITECETGKTFHSQEEQEIFEYLNIVYTNYLNPENAKKSNNQCYLKYSRKAQSEVLSKIVLGLNNR